MTILIAVIESGLSPFGSTVLNRPHLTQSGKKRQTGYIFIYKWDLSIETDICQRNLPVRLETPKQSVVL